MAKSAKPASNHSKAPTKTSGLFSELWERFYAATSAPRSLIHDFPIPRPYPQSPPPMPTILRVLGFRFYFFSQEGNEPPHVHIDKDAGTLKVWLDDLSVASSEGLKPAEIRAALRITREYRIVLLETWHEFQNRKN